MVIHIGLDLVSVGQVADAAQGPAGRRYLSRIYTADEIEDCRTPTGIDPAQLAARFAAKEATLKALSTGDEGASFRDIEVRKDPSGRTRLALHGRMAERAEAMGLVDLALALTYETGYAAAVVVANRAVPE